MQASIPSTADIIINKLQTWWELFVSNIPNLAIALVVLITAYYISRFAYRGTLKVTKKRIPQTSVAKLLARVMSVVIVLSGLLLALGALNLGKTLTTLISAAGISGLVIGLALQGTLSNTFAGIVLSFRKNISLGNWVETNGFSGEVMDINLNYFVLKEADNNHVIIPNKTIIENPIKNHSLTTRTRIMLECGVGYESDLEQVEHLVKETLFKTFDQIKDPNEVEFFYREFGGSSINFLCRFWVDSESGIEKLIAKSKSIIEIKKAFDRESINIPYPIRTLQFDNKIEVETNGSQEVFSAN